MRIGHFIIAVFILCLSTVVSGQKIGINTTTPQAVLDINGDIITRPAALIVADGITEALDVNTNRFSYYRITGPTSDFTIAGIMAGIDGRIITLFNRSGFTMQINNEDPSAAVADMIVTGTNTDLSIINKGIVSLQYDGVEQEWIVKSSSKGNTVSSGFWDINGNDIYNINPGNVGIGTSAAPDKLTVETDNNNYGITHRSTQGNILSTRIGGTTAGIGTFSPTDMRIYSGGLSRIIISQATGGVFIGTDDPAIGTRLTVQTLNNSDGISHIGENGNILSTRMGGTSAGIGTFSNTNMRLYSNGNSAMIIDAANGNIGIGTDAPTAKLHIAGNLKIVGINTLEFGVGFPKETNAGKIGYQAFSTALDIIGAGNSTASRSIKFWNEGGAEFTGNIGIGTPATFGVRLHINQDVEALRLSGNQPYMTFFNGAGYKGYMRSINADDMELGTAPGNTNGKLNFTVKGIPYLSLNNTGQVSVNGPPAPYLDPKLTVNGVVSIIGDSEWTLETGECISPNGPCLFFYGNGFYRSKIDADGDWVSASDRSLKEEIKSYRPVLENIKKLQVATYHLKYNPSGLNSFGLIAQNVADYFPEIVSSFTGKSGEALLGISYSKTGVLAIKAIQEQQQIIEEQQHKINVLEKRLASLEKLIQEKLK